MANAPTINFIRFEELFDKLLLEPQQYFKEIPKKGLLLTLITWLNHYELILGGEVELETTSKKQILFLSDALQISAYLSYIRLKNLFQVAAQQKKKLIWITPYTCLEIIEYLLLNYSKIIFNNGLFDLREALKEQKEINNEQLINIIKGYFAFANSRLDKISISIDVPFQELVRKQFSDRISTYELERSDNPLIFYVEFIKSLEFFDFLELTYKDLLNYFLITKSVQSQQQYILIITGFLDKFNENTKVRVESGSEKERDVRFFDTLVSSNAYLKPKANFKNLKIFPLLKYDDNAYLLIYRTFAFEKIYKTLYFEVQEVAKKEKVALNKSDLGKQYFEEWLCSKYVNKIFKSKKIINLEGTNPIFKKAKIEPDHYIRNWNDVFIFEYKDVLIADNAKVSYDEEVVLNELYTKLVKKSNGKNSAVIQLANFILNFENNHKTFDPSAQANRLTFYPILVVQDRCLSTPGINQILNDWFQEIIDINPGKRPQIKHFVIINIDCLINYLNMFEGNPSAFKKCLLEYLKFEAKTEKHKKLYSFDIWMRREYLLKENRGKKVFDFINNSYNEKRDKLIRMIG